MQSLRRNPSILFASLAAILLTVLAAFGARVLRSIEYSDDFSHGNLDHWQFPYPEDWTVGTEGPLHFLHMLRSREPLVPRRPMQFALLKGVTVGSFNFQARVRRAQSSLIMVFNYVDTLHFYYTHLSKDPGAKIDVHNGLFLVDGAPRRRIAGKEASPVLPDKEWHTIRIHRDVHSGSIEVFVDAEATPRFSVVDHTFSCGQVGVGSFDETGDFTDIRLTSNDAGCKPGTGVTTRPAGAN